MEPVLLTDPKLADVLAELQKREPVFHRPEFGTGRRDFENIADANFWEVGASGRRYSRDYVIDTLVTRHSSPHRDEWRATDFHCVELGPRTYLVTYTLRHGAARITRRASVWRQSHEGWKILYHQGTVVESPLTRSAAQP